MFDDESLVVVGDLFLHYLIGYDEENSTVQIYCERCDKNIGSFDTDAVHDHEEEALYEKIISLHKSVGVE